MRLWYLSFPGLRDRISISLAHLRLFSHICNSANAGVSWTAIRVCYFDLLSVWGGGYAQSSTAWFLWKGSQMVGVNRFRLEVRPFQLLENIR